MRNVTCTVPSSVEGFRFKCVPHTVILTTERINATEQDGWRSYAQFACKYGVYFADISLNGDSIRMRAKGHEGKTRASLTFRRDVKDWRYYGGPTMVRTITQERTQAFVSRLVGRITSKAERTFVRTWIKRCIGAWIQEMSKDSVMDTILNDLNIMSTGLTQIQFCQFRNTQDAVVAITGQKSRPIGHMMATLLGLRHITLPVYKWVQELWNLTGNIDHVATIMATINPTGSDGYSYCHVPAMKAAITMLRAGYSAKRITKILNNDTYTIHGIAKDTMHMLASPDVRNAINDPDITWPRQPSVRQLHNHCIRVVNFAHAARGAKSRKKLAKQKIPHAWAKNLPATFAEFEVRVPTSRADLWKWGEELHNCMSTYGQKAANGKSLVIVLEKDGIAKHAIELNCRHEIIQATADHNKPWTAKERDQLQHWIANSIGILSFLQ